MKATLLFIALALAPTSAPAAELGKWRFGSGQGISEYSIQNDSAGNDEFSIACSDDWGTFIDLRVGGKQPSNRSTVTIDVDADEFTFAADERGRIRTASHVDNDNFRALWRDIRRGSLMRVRLQSGKSTTFRLSGASAVLEREVCKTDFER
jgi:hypothetical protein